MMQSASRGFGAAVAVLAGATARQALAARGPRRPGLPRQLFGGSRGHGTGRTLSDFTVKNIDGESVQLSQYKGQVALIVNVASK